MAAVAARYCKNCGEKITSADRFCFKCGEAQLTTSSSNTDPSSSISCKTASLEQFKESKSIERSSFFRPKCASGGRTTKKPTATAVKIPKKAQNIQVNINVGIMEPNDNGDLKAIRGKKLPLKVFTNSSYEDIKKASIEKHAITTIIWYVSMKPMCYFIQTARKHIIFLDFCQVHRFNWIFTKKNLGNHTHR